MGIRSFYAIVPSRVAFAAVEFRKHRRLPYAEFEINQLIEGLSAGVGGDLQCLANAHSVTGQPICHPDGGHTDVVALGNLAQRIAPRNDVTHLLRRAALLAHRDQRIGRRILIKVIAYANENSLSKLILVGSAAE